MVQTTVRMPEKVSEWLRREAKERGISKNSLILILLHEVMKEKDTAE